MIAIEPATINDEAYITSLAPRFAESLPEWRAREEIADGTRAHLRAAVRDGNTEHSAVFMAREHGQELGFVWVVTIEDFYSLQNVAKVSEIAVSREGLGIGRGLMSAAEAWARARNCSLLTLNVMEKNQRARTFYHSLGFAPEYINLVKPL